MTPDAARVTVLRLGNAILRPVAFLRDEARFGAAFLPALFLAGLFLAVLERFADALRALLLRAGPLLPALLRAGPRLPRELELREPARDEVPLAEDFRPPERLALFLPPLEPPRDDFLAAAMIRAPI